MKIKTLLVFAAVAFLLVVELGSQAAQPAILITALPVWGQDGTLSGHISGPASEQTSLYLFAFIPDIGWYELPGMCGPANVQNGQFSVNATPNITLRSATRYSAFLIPASVVTPCGYQTSTIPFVIQHNAIASVTYPRLPQLSTLTFAGLEWYIKDSPVQVYPGPQFFLKDNAFVDSQGQLHLRISRCGGSWCAAEVYTKQTIGYGTYQFTVNSPLNNLDPNVTLGLFSWDAQAGDQNNREWDIEFSRWGNPAASANAQYVVQPYSIPGNIQHFSISFGNPSTHVVTWSPSQIGFVSSVPQGRVNQWTFAGAATPVPTPDDVHLHMNFYVGAGQSPSVPVPQEIVIGAFQYQPSGPQIGFSRATDNLPFQGQTYTVPLAPTSAACSAVVESDSLWLSILGSNSVPAGATLQYATSDNLGSPRTGNLILRSTNCNAPLGAQVLTITQAGLVCAPGFAVSSTHIGFLQSAFPVFIRGTVSACSWSVASSAPWLQITSPASGAGDGSIQLSAASNSDLNLRGAVLSLSNGPIHSVYQDAAGGFLALSPLSAVSCSGQVAQFGVSWIAPGNVEIHLNLPAGPLVGKFGPTGTAALSNIADGTLVFLVQTSDASQPTTLASVRATVTTSNCNAPAIAPLGIVNAASYSATSLAPGALATVFGSNLSSTTLRATGTAYPATLGGVTLSVAGQLCPLSYVSPSQINFQMPSNLAPGRYTLMVGSAAAETIVVGASPGIFTLKGDGTGVPLAAVTAVLPDGSASALPPYQCSAGGCSIASMALPGGWTDLYIVLYGTGIRGARSISGALGQFRTEVDFVGPQGQYPGLDQVNLHLKGPVALSGLQPLQLNADGAVSNTVSLQFQ